MELPSGNTLNTNPKGFNRRTFVQRIGLAAGLAVGALGGGTAQSRADVRTPPHAPKPYAGPNVILIRFGGGARRRESIEPRHTQTPFTCHELVRRGVLFPRMEIDQSLDLNTSHGEGTLNLITGRYDKYRDIGETRPEAGQRFLGARFEAKVPTVFEYLRAEFAVPDHQTLIVNSEDRGDEEFYNFSNHHLFGVRYKSQTLSLRRYKAWLLRDQIRRGVWREADLPKKLAALKQMESIDYRADKEQGQGAAIDGFWARWRDHYGESGLVNARGDRLLTQLSIRALQELRPRLLMINYQDCDYVHWGIASHYTRALSIMDDGIQQVVRAVEADPEYRDNTVFAVVPDCGRDDNPYMDVPCQHHFNSRASHEIFALFFGPGIPKGVVVDKTVQQTSVAPTLAHAMHFKAEFASAPILEEVFS